MLSSTSRPLSPARVSGWSVLSQLPLRQAGAGARLAEGALSSGTRACACARLADSRAAPPARAAARERAKSKVGRGIEPPDVVAQETLPEGKRFRPSPLACPMGVSIFPPPRPGSSVGRAAD